MHMAWEHEVGVSLVPSETRSQLFPEPALPFFLSFAQQQLFIKPRIQVLYFNVQWMERIQGN